MTTKRTTFNEFLLDRRLASAIQYYNIDPDQLFETIIYLAENHELTQDNLDRVIGEAWFGIPGAARGLMRGVGALAGGAKAAAAPLVQGAQAVGGAIGRGAQAAGSAIGQGASAVGKGAQAVGGAIGRGAGAVGNAALGAVDALGQGAVDAGKFVGNSFKNVAVDSAKGIGQAGAAVGGAIGKGAQAVGGAVGKAGSAVGNAAKQYGSSIAQGAKQGGDAMAQQQAKAQLMDRLQKDVPAALKELGIDPEQAKQMTLASILQLAQGGGGQGA
jgi:hypothetical protein